MTSNPPHLAGSYAPVADELTAYELPTTGSIPSELTGWYLRNGPEPVRRRVRHWFFGERRHWAGCYGETNAFRAAQIERREP